MHFTLFIQSIEFEKDKDCVIGGNCRSLLWFYNLLKLVLLIQVIWVIFAKSQIYIQPWDCILVKSTYCTH